MNPRDAIIGELAADPLRMTPYEIIHLRLQDVTGDRRGSGFLPVRRKVALSDRVLTLSEGLRQSLDEYINTEDAEEMRRPFLDYRPNIGSHLFPSPRTGRALSQRSVRIVLSRFGQPTACATADSSASSRNRGFGRQPASWRQLPPRQPVQVEQTGVQASEALDEELQPVGVRRRQPGRPHALQPESTENRHEGQAVVEHRRPRICIEAIRTVDVGSPRRPLLTDHDDNNNDNNDDERGPDSGHR